MANIHGKPAGRQQRVKGQCLHANLTPMIHLCLYKSALRSHVPTRRQGRAFSLSLSLCSFFIWWKLVHDAQSHWRNPRIVLNSGVFAFNMEKVQTKQSIFSHLFGPLVDLLHFDDTSSLMWWNICRSCRQMRRPVPDLQLVQVVRDNDWIFTQEVVSWTRTSATTTPTTGCMDHCHTALSLDSKRRTTVLTGIKFVTWAKHQQKKIIFLTKPVIRSFFGGFYKVDCM